MTPLMNSPYPRSTEHHRSEPRNSVVNTILSYGRAQTFMSGSNLASTPSEDVFDDSEGTSSSEGDDDAGLQGDDEDEDDRNWERDRLLRAVAHEDEELLVGHPEWVEDVEPATPTALGPPRHTSSSPPILPIISRATSSSRAGSYHRHGPVSSRQPSRSRFAPGTARPPSLGASPDSLQQRLENYPSSTLAPSLQGSKPSGSSSSSTVDKETTPLLTASSPGPTTKYVPTKNQTPLSNTAAPPHQRYSTPSDAALQLRHALSPRQTASSNRKLSHASPVHGPSMKKRRASAPPAMHRGSSTFGQTLFNSIAILLGIGMLSEPLAYACAGWVGGTMLIIFYGFLTCYTAKILGRIILSDPRLRTYADIGQAAFGPRSNFLTSSLFCMELFAVNVVLVVLFSDSLHAVIPTYSSNTYKLLGLLIIIPTSFLPLRVLSFASVMGIVSTLALIFVVVWDGATKLDAPGSLWEPAHTDLIPADFLSSVPISFGLFMAGFAGHAVIPSLVRDMADPTEFKSMINWAFFVATLIYALIGAAGYRMFGRSVSDEVSQDLLKIPQYNPILNRLAVWMLVLSPLTKFSLSSRPMSVTIEILLGIEEPISAIPEHNKPHTQNQGPPKTLPYDGPHEPHISKSPDDIEGRPDRGGAGGGVIVTTTDDENPQSLYISPNPHLRQAQVVLERKKSLWRVVERTTLTISIVLAAIYVPDFSTTMSFLGAFSAFILCVIGPLVAKMAIEKRVKVHDALLMVIAIIMAAWGTYVGLTTSPA